MADVRFRGIGMKAWVREADALLFGGKPDEARWLLADIVALPGSQMP